MLKLPGRELQASQVAWGQVSQRLCQGGLGKSTEGVLEVEGVTGQGGEGSPAMSAGGQGGVKGGGEGGGGGPRGVAS